MSRHAPSDQKLAVPFALEPEDDEDEPLLMDVVVVAMGTFL